MTTGTPIHPFHSDDAGGFRPPMMKKYRLPIIAIIWAVLSVLAATGSAEAALKTWSGGTGDWNTPASWTGGTVPVPGDIVDIPASAGDVVTLSQTVGAYGNGLGSVTVGAGTKLVLNANGSFQKSSTRALQAALARLTPPAGPSSITVHSWVLPAPVWVAQLSPPASLTLYQASSP
jgi:hypothetical protein